MGAIGVAREDNFRNWTLNDAQKERSSYDFDVSSPEFANKTKYFRTSNSFEINEQLRDLASGDITRLSKSVQGSVDAMEEYMRPLSKSVVGYRFLSSGVADFFGVGDISNPNRDVIGTHIVDPAFMSMSYDMNKNVFQNRPIILRLHVPKGTKAIVPNNDDESEIALNRNTGYTITNVSRERVSFSSHGRADVRESEKLVIDVVVDKPRKRRGK